MRERPPPLGPSCIGHEHLGGQHDLLAVGVLLQRPPGDLLAGAAGVDVGRVDDVDAGLERRADRLPGEVLALGPRVAAPVGVAPAHRPERDPRDLEPGGAEPGVAHQPAALPRASNSSSVSSIDGRRGVLLEVRDAGGARDRQHHRRAAQQPGQRQLRGRRAVLLGDRPRAGRPCLLSSPVANGNHGMKPMLCSVQWSSSASALAVGEVVAGSAPRRWSAICCAACELRRPSTSDRPMWRILPSCCSAASSPT